jgi:hypothetical protein
MLEQKVMSSLRSTCNEEDNIKVTIRDRGTFLGVTMVFEGGSPAWDKCGNNNILVNPMPELSVSKLEDEEAPKSMNEFPSPGDVE